MRDSKAWKGGQQGNNTTGLCPDLLEHKRDELGGLKMAASVRSQDRQLVCHVCYAWHSAGKRPG